MKFTASTAGYYYRAGADNVKLLEKYGFTFDKIETPRWMSINNSGVETVTPSYKKVELEFKTLEELMKFIKDVGEIVLSEESITVYDDYLE